MSVGRSPHNPESVVDPAQREEDVGRHPLFFLNGEQLTQIPEDAEPAIAALRERVRELEEYSEHLSRTRDEYLRRSGERVEMTEASKQQPVDPALAKTQPRRWILQSHPTRRTWDVVGAPPETSTDVVEVVEALPAPSDEVVVVWTKAEAEVVEDELDDIEPLTGTCLLSAHSKLSTALESE